MIWRPRPFLQPIGRATGGGGGNAASGLPEIKKPREALTGTATGDARSRATGGGGGNRTHG